MGKIINLEENGYFNSPKFKSDELVDEALECASKSKALKLAKQALEIYPENIDAENLIVEYEENLIKKLKKQDEILAKATKQMEEQNMFDKENIGIFWGLIGTRPYMRTRHNRILTLLALGRYSEAINECEEMLKLCTNDNMGIRYILIGLYCVLEKFEKCEKLYKKYKDESLMMVLPMAIMYFKKGDYKKTKEFLNKVEEQNEFVLGFLLGDAAEPLSEEYPGYYSHGSEQEAYITIEHLLYLLTSVPSFIYFIDVEYRKKKH